MAVVTIHLQRRFEWPSVPLISIVLAGLTHLIWAVNNPLPLSVVMMGFGVGLFCSLVSFIPGGLGIMEGSMTAVFVSLGVPMEPTVLAVLIFRLTYQIIPLVVSLFLFHGLVRQSIRQLGSRARG